ncbi:membrane protein [Actinoplanes italicus]|uniref:Putative membrane protein n=1 Tax=Actinoplanes italicus TaxID=113567 RepID=A0A2T0KHG9_9ACTN|nr:DUF998 domain-containing protein [Actinoplanes italicus]PRX22677.1 putative membrane protein [Actinoplanes italicus]GIE28197.1 membrane protein [Actinoplanes italicus]
MTSRVPWWVLTSSAVAPVALIGGWTLAARRQPGGFDGTVETISALAGHGAAGRWLMTAALVCVGICHLVTAAGLHPAARAGRAVLAAGGVATMLVAVFPLPVAGPAPAHGAAAGLAFAALSVWPALAWRRHVPAPVTLRPLVSCAAAAVLLALVAWFAVTLVLGGRAGLTERVAAGAQACWPLVVALSSRWAVAPRRRD